MSLATLTSSGPTVAGRGARVVAVASGKGGVGKTWFAVTLAHALARAGRRALLVDGDLGLANVDIQLGLMPPRDLAAVVADGASLADVATAFAPGGFDVVAGRSGSGSLARLDPARLRNLGARVLEAARAYDWVVLDLGAGVEATVRALTGPAGRCFVLCTDEPTSLTDAYAFIKLTARDKPAPDIRVVVNQVATRADGDRTYRTLLKACQAFLGLSPPLAGVIRRDPRVRDAIRAQSPILIRYPAAQASTDVEAIAARLLAER